MKRRTLPPLEVGAVYRVNDFDHFDYTAQTFHKELTGEDIAILRLHLANQTILEIPTNDVALHFLLRNLIEAYGTVAIEHLKMRGWI